MVSAYDVFSSSLLSGLRPPPAKALIFLELLLRIRFLEKGHLRSSGLVQETGLHGSLIIRRSFAVHRSFPRRRWLSRFSPSSSAGAPSVVHVESDQLAGEGGMAGGRGRGRPWREWPRKWKGMFHCNVSGHIYPDDN